MASPANLISRWAIFPAALALSIMLAACGNSGQPTNESLQMTPSPRPPESVKVALTQDSDEDQIVGAAPTTEPTLESSSGSELLSSGETTGRSQSTPATPVDYPAPESVNTAAGQMLAAFEEALNRIYVSAVPSVVYIRVPSAAASAFQGVPGIPDDLLWSAGSGFVWDDEGHIVTNHHVVEDAIGQPGSVTVVFSDSSQAKGTVIGSDPHSDLAVIKLEDGDWSLVPATLGDSSSVRVGQLTVAIGAPFGQEFTMTSGIVSAVGRNISGQGQFTIPEVIQTDSAINPGNSGGPLLDRHGRVIGINTQIISRTGSFSGVGMAVPVDIAKRVIPPLISEGEFDYPWLGVSIAPVETAYAEEVGLPTDTRGALIITVVDGSPADKAGLLGSESTVEIDGIEFRAGGDIVVSIGEHAISNPSELIAHLTYHNGPGERIILGILRDGQPKDLEVTLGRRPQSP